MKEISYIADFFKNRLKKFSERWTDRTSSKKAFANLELFFKEKRLLNTKSYPGDVNVVEIPS